MCLLFSTLSVIEHWFKPRRGQVNFICWRNSDIVVNVSVVPVVVVMFSPNNIEKLSIVPHYYHTTYCDLVFFVCLFQTVIFGSYMIAHGFFNVYAMCVDTLFLCFCKYSSVFGAWLRSYLIVQDWLLSSSEFLAWLFQYFLLLRPSRLFLFLFLAFTLHPLSFSCLSPPPALEPGPQVKT